MRGGAVELGRTYEQRMSALLAIRMTLDDNVKNFWMASNIGGVGEFDDIVIFKELRNGTKNMFFVQLKHKENQTIQVQMLEKINKKTEADAKTKIKEGDFQLTKYQKSYENIKESLEKSSHYEGISAEEVSLILYTNTKIGSKKGDIVTVLPGDTIDFLNTSSSERNSYIISNNHENGPQNFNEEFLSKFVLCTQQARAFQLDEMIGNELRNCFGDLGNAEIISITDFFSKWCFGQKNKIIKLQKPDVQSKLLEVILSSMIMNPSNIIEQRHDILYYMNSTILSFNITVFSTKTLLKYLMSCIMYFLGQLLQTQLDELLSWNTVLSQKQLDLLFAPTTDSGHTKLRKALVFQKNIVSELTVKDLYVTSWLCGLIPLVLNDFSPTVILALEKFIEVSKQVSFAGYSKNFPQFKNDLKTFNNLSNLQEKNLIEGNLKSMHLSLQGKRHIGLEAFLTNNAIICEITPDIYVTLLCEDTVIGEKLITEPYYIERSLILPSLDIDVLKKQNVLKFSGQLPIKLGDLFIIVEEKGRLPFWLQNHKVDLEHYLLNLLGISEDFYILTTDETFSDIIIEVCKFLNTRTLRNIHILCPNEKECFSWLHSEGSCANLSDFLVTNAYMSNLHENDLQIKMANRINIISADAGMGKSFLLRSIATKFDPDHWIILINIKDHYEEISKITSVTDFLGYLFLFHMKFTQQILSKFCSQLFLDRFNMSKIVILLDGYDEISTEIGNVFLEKFKVIQKLRFWVTTRSTVQIALETTLGTLSSKIRNFTDNEQSDFLRKYFEAKNEIYHYENSQIDYIVDTVRKCSSKLDRSLVGIPLQMRMFSEIFGEDISSIKETENFTIINLYDMFVNIKLKEYKLYEATSLKRTLSKLAMKYFFTDEYIKGVIDLKELEEDALAFKETYKKDSIVIGLDSNGDAVFGHRSFAEYLSAYFLSQKIIDKRYKSGFNKDCKVLIKKLFNYELLRVRIFFDRILTQDLPLHTAVLGNDLSKIESLLLDDSHIFDDVDSLGRTASHLAVSHGKFYDVYNNNPAIGVRIRGLHSSISKTNDGFKIKIPDFKEYQVKEETLRILLEHNNDSKKDCLFGYDLLDFALESASLENLDLLYHYSEDSDFRSNDNLVLPLFLICIAYANLHNILSNRKNFGQIEPCPNQNSDELRSFFKEIASLISAKFNDRYLTEIAASRNSKEVIIILLYSQVLQIDNGFLLHRACSNGHVETLDLLVKMGREVDEYDESGISPIGQAGMLGRSDLIYELLRDPKIVSQGSNICFTPLHYACQGGHFECVQSLIKLGANVNKKDSYGLAPIHYAALYGHIDILVKLLESDLETETITKALHVAASHNNTECVKKIIDSGNYINVCNEEGNTALTIASSKGHIDILQLLVTYDSCNLNFLNEKENFDKILNWAQRNNYVDLSIKMIPLSPKLNRTQGGVSALHFATRNGYKNCVRLLLDSGVDKTIKDGVENFHYTPFLWSVLYCRPEIMKTLWSSYENEINAEEFQYALFWATILNNLDCIKLLKQCNLSGKNYSYNELPETLQKFVSIEFGFDVFRIKDRKNINMLMAAKMGNLEVIQELQYTTEELNVSLHWASRGQNHKCVEGLLELGADKNFPDDIKGLCYPPIVWAAMYGKLENIKIFLKQESRESVSTDFSCALNWAAQQGHLDCVKFLLEFGINVDNIDDRLNGNTPLLCACEYSRSLDIVDTLIAYNCDVNIRNKENKDALEISAEKDHFIVIRSIMTAKSFKSYIVSKTSKLHEKLQFVIKSAVEKEDLELLLKLSEMGINRNN